MNLREQITNSILMIRPAHFGFNKETAVNNAFQIQDTQLSPTEIQQAAIHEFDNLVALLERNGIQVTVANDSDFPQKPDAVFPNNWVSFHQDGTIITYPMFSPIRRQERDEKILELLKDAYGFDKSYALELFESQNSYLEGTGSMVLDRVHKLAYACISPRTNLNVLDAFCEFTGYEAVSFSAVDDTGNAIYHTNVMMAVAKDFVIICLDTILDELELAKLKEKFQNTGKTIIPISLAQMKAFAGNMLQLKNKQGADFLVMSEQAYLVLTEEQRSEIEKFTQILYSPIYTIEKFGGGSTRCMIAEVFSPQK